MLTCVDNAHGDGSLIAFTQESRHIGLNHQFFLSHGFCINVAIQHIGRMGHTHQSPCGQALRQRELQRHPTLVVSLQLGIEECCLIQIFAQRHLFFLLRLF